uniref:Uncharacterized protein n=1 Tax=Rhizophagus irregularis (strain DAOM 181602 / DAOM 197198 / MUCL 43194) TaxID=747089 RepID=U9T6V4_RHIID
MPAYPTNLTLHLYKMRIYEDNSVSRSKIPAPVSSSVIHAVENYDPLPSSIHVRPELLPYIPQRPIYSKTTSSFDKKPHVRVRLEEEYAKFLLDYLTTVGAHLWHYSDLRSDTSDDTKELEQRPNKKKH